MYIHICTVMAILARWDRTFKILIGIPILVNDSAMVNQLRVSKNLQIPNFISLCFLSGRIAIVPSLLKCSTQRSTGAVDTVLYIYFCWLK